MPRIGPRAVDSGRVRAKNLVETGLQPLLHRTGRRRLAIATVAGVFFFLVGCFFAYLGARTASVRCHRREAAMVACDVTERVFGIVPAGRHHFESVERALVGYAGDASDPSYRVELSTARGWLPLSTITASESQCAAFVRRFNLGIAAGRGTVQLVQWPDWVGIVVLPIPFVFCLLTVGMVRGRDRAVTPGAPPSR